jgi:hypothetical protein
MLLFGALLLFGVPGAASAAAASPPGAAAALPAPVLESATIKLNRVILTWERVADDRVTGYVIRANGRLLPHGWRTGATSDIATIDFGPGDGLTGREVYTVAAGSDFGADGIPRTVSPPSNGLVPVAPGTLPAPELTDATVERFSDGSARVTLTWTPSRSEDETIIYVIFADGQAVTDFANVTTATFFPDLCGGGCPLSGTETYTVKAIDRTMAESPMSNGLVPTER